MDNLEADILSSEIEYNEEMQSGYPGRLTPMTQTTSEWEIYYRKAILARLNKALEEINLCGKTSSEENTKSETD